MTTTQTQPAFGAAAAKRRSSFSGVLRSEYLKLMTLRSTYWLSGITVAGALTTAGMFALLFRVTDDAMVSSGPGVSGPESAAGPTFVSLAVTSTALITIGILAVLSITSEYSSGSVRTTFTAVPGRQRVLAAKAVIISLFSAVITLVSGLLAWLTMSLIYSDGFSDGGPTAVEVLGGTVLYLVAIALFALAVGTLVRSSAAAMSIVLGMFLILEQVLLLVAMFNETVATITAFLPSTAGSLITRASVSQDMLAAANAPALSPWEGFGVLMIWVVVLYLLGALRLQKGDA